MAVCFVCRLDDEMKARKDLEKDLDTLRKVKDDTKTSHDQMQREIDLVKDELARLEREHADVRLDFHKFTHSCKSD